MKEVLNKAFKYKLKTVSGILVPAPRALRTKNIDFMLIGEDDVEYHLSANRKTFKMWNLVDSRIQVTGFIAKKSSRVSDVATLTYQCIEEYLDDDSSTLDAFEDFDLDPNRFDYAI